MSEPPGCRKKILGKEKTNCTEHDDNLENCGEGNSLSEDVNVDGEEHAVKTSNFFERNKEMKRRTISRFFKGFAKSRFSI